MDFIRCPCCCSKQFPDKSQLIDHLLSTNSNVVCPICKKENLQNINELISHLIADCIEPQENPSHVSQAQITPPLVNQEYIPNQPYSIRNEYLNCNTSFLFNQNKRINEKSNKSSFDSIAYVENNERNNLDRAESISEPTVNQPISDTTGNHIKNILETSDNHNLNILDTTGNHTRNMFDTPETHTCIVDDTTGRNFERVYSVVDTNDATSSCLNNLNRVSNTSIANPTNNIHNNLHRNKKSNLNQIGRKTTSKEEDKLFLDIKSESDANGQHCQMIKNPIKTNFNKLNTTSQEINQNKRSLQQNRKRKTDDKEKRNENICVRSDNANVRNYNTSVRNDNTSVRNDNTSVRNDETSVRNDNTSVIGVNSTIKRSNRYDAGPSTSSSSREQNIHNKLQLEKVLNNPKTTTLSDNFSVHNGNDKEIKSKISINNITEQNEILKSKKHFSLIQSTSCHNNVSENNVTASIEHVLSNEVETNNSNTSVIDDTFATPTELVINNDVPNGATLNHESENQLRQSEESQSNNDVFKKATSNPICDNIEKRETPILKCSSSERSNGIRRNVETVCSNTDASCCLNNLNRVSNTSIVNPTNNIHNNLHRNKKSNLNQFGRKTTSKEEDKLFLDIKSESDANGQHCQMIKNPIKTNFNKLNSTSQEINQNKRSLKQNRKRKTDDKEKKNDNTCARSGNANVRNYNTNLVKVKNSDEASSNPCSEIVLELNRHSQDSFRINKDNLMKTLSQENKVVMRTSNILKGNSDHQEDCEATAMQNNFENDDLQRNMNTAEIVTNDAENDYLNVDETNRTNNLIRITNQVTVTPNNSQENNTTSVPNQLCATPSVSQINSTVSFSNQVNTTTGNSQVINTTRLPNQLHAIRNTRHVNKNTTPVTTNQSLPSTSKNIGKYFVNNTDSNNGFEKNENFNKKDLLKIKQNFNTDERSIIKRSNSLNIKNINNELDNPSTSKKNIIKSNSFSMKNNVQNEINTIEPLVRHETHNDRQNLSIERNNLSKVKNRINNVEQLNSGEILNNIEESGNTPPRLVRIINNLDKFNRMLNNEQLREDSLDMYRLDEASNDFLNHNNLREDKNINHSNNGIVSNRNRNITMNHLSEKRSKIISVNTKGNNANFTIEATNNTSKANLVRKNDYNIPKTFHRNIINHVDSGAKDSINNLNGPIPSVTSNSINEISINPTNDNSSRSSILTDLPNSIDERKMYSCANNISADFINVSNNVASHFIRSCDDNSFTVNFTEPSTVDSVEPSTVDSIEPCAVESIEPSPVISNEPSTVDSIKPSIIDSIESCTFDSIEQSTINSIENYTASLLGICSGKKNNIQISKRCLGNSDIIGNDTTPPMTDNRIPIENTQTVHDANMSTVRNDAKTSSSKNSECFPKDLDSESHIVNSDITISPIHSSKEKDLAYSFTEDSHNVIESNNISSNIPHPIESTCSNFLGNPLRSSTRFHSIDDIENDELSIRSISEHNTRNDSTIEFNGVESTDIHTDSEQKNQKCKEKRKPFKKIYLQEQNRK